MNDEELIDHLVATGVHASKGAARRALGISAPAVEGNEALAGRIRSGIAGAKPKLPNA